MYIINGIVLLLSVLVWGSPVLSASNMDLEQENAIRRDIREEVGRAIAPWRPNHSKGGMNLDKRFGDPIWKMDFPDGGCEITLTFPKGPFDKGQAADFQLDAVNKIYKAFAKNHAYPEKVVFRLYSKNGKKFEGIAIGKRDDNQIRWRAQE